MKRFLFRVLCLGLTSLWLAQTAPGYARGAEGKASGVPPAPGAVKDAPRAGVEVMTRGPIHEAFAQPVNTGSVRPLVVPKSPPAAIEETPPDLKPAEEDVLWIPGYWGWDDDRSDFVWVSGVWRVPPPGQRWIPGYWVEVSGGYQWVAGFWSGVDTTEVAYYPEPPASVEQGPTSEPPSPDYVWISGSWRWRDARYMWQPGYWVLGQPGWLWMPASYCWSPYGWAYMPGYWDYPLMGRGLAFAPVYFGGGLLGPRFGYTPTVAIDTGILSMYLFTRPSYYHYYFGDYFAPTYDRIGIFPWFGVGSYGGYAYDPLFSYYRWDYSRRDPRWLANLQGWHTYYRDHPERRPPRDLAAQQQLLARAQDRPDSRFLAIASPLQDLRQKPDAPVTLAAVGAQEKTQIVQTARTLADVRTQRVQVESGAAIAPGAGAAKIAGKAAAGAALKAPLKAPLPRLPAGAEGAAPRIATRPGVTPPATPGAIKGKSGEAPKPGLTPPAAKRTPPPKPTPAPKKPEAAPRPEAGRGEAPEPGRRPPPPSQVEKPRPAPPERNVPERGRAPERGEGKGKEGR